MNQKITSRDLKEALSDLYVNGPAADGESETTVDLGEYGDDPGASVHLVNSHERYRGFQEIGRGGVGTVSSCLDPHLGRPVAIKALNIRHRRNREQRIRFIREARVMSQLEHPNIVPVHELGTQEDGSVYFSMKLIEGVTLRDVIDGLIKEDTPFAEVYTLKRLLDVFLNVCNAVAFAHSRGVLHRDLKPDNILIGSFGEVLVLDWGLAKILHHRDVDTDSDVDLEKLLDIKKGDVTMDGSVSGTPLYMAPEQALGKNSELDERTDEYSLGTILYEILTLERPIDGENVKIILEQIVGGRIIPPRRFAPERKIPRELEAICLKALSTQQEDRYRSIPEMVEDIDRYLHGHPILAATDSVFAKGWKWCKRHALFSSTVTAALLAIGIAYGSTWLIRRTRSQALLELADERRREGDRHHAERTRLHREFRTRYANRIRKAVPKEEQSLQDQLRRTSSSAENYYDIAAQLYGMALQLTRDKTAQRRSLYEIYRKRMAYAAATRDYAKLGDFLSYSQEWLGKGFDQASPMVRKQLLTYQKLVSGEATLSILAPPGTTLTLARISENGSRILVAGDSRPVRTGGLELSPGSYIITAQTAYGSAVHPVHLSHAEKRELTITVPRTTPAGTVYVPEGQFLRGGPFARHYQLHQHHLPAFFIKREEVTYKEYLEFWLDPEGADRADEDRPRLRLVTNGPELKAWDDAGEMIPLLKPYLPVVGVSQQSATKFCRWLSAKMGRLYRLPTADEWEKAARGVDGREFVWGNHFNPEFALTLENKIALAAVTYWAPPGSFPIDRSVYGAFDMGGNVREWTSSRFLDDSPFYQIKGGSASLTQRFLHCSYASDTPVLPSDVGFRYMTPEVRSDLE